jgi:glycosyltransferase involved in cell wall biosynthesis
MKLAILTSDYWPNIGGVAAHIGHLTQALARKGLEVTIYNFVEQNNLESAEEVAGVRVLRFTLRHLASPWRRYGEIYHLAQEVKRAFAMARPDLAHFHTCNVDGLILRWGPRNTPKVFTNHTAQYLEMWEKPLGRLRIRLKIPPCDAVIAPSRELAEKSRFLRVRPSNIHYIPNGVDTETYDGHCGGDEIRQRFGIEPQELIVLCARRFDPKNGLIYFARGIPAILRGCPSAQILFVGDGNAEEKRKILDCVRSAGVASRVKFAGSVPNHEMPAYYAAANLSVIPSLLEATSLTCLESMASKVPVVATDVGGLPELITHEKEGLLVPPRDTNGLVASILELLHDPDRRRVLGEEGRKKVVAEYSWGRIAQRTIAVYEQVLREAGMIHRAESRTHAAEARPTD